MESEAAGVTECVQHPPACREAGNRAAVVALVEIETRLLSLPEMNEEANAVLLHDDGFGRDFSPKGAVVQFQPLQLADAALGANVNSLRLQLFDQQLNQQVAPLCHAQGGELNNEPAIVLIDRKTGKAVAFAEDHAASAPWSGTS